MKNILNYIKTMNKVFKARKEENDSKEDDHLAQADTQWYALSNEERYKINDMAILEKFFEMRKSWKQFHKDGKHKKKKIEYQVYIPNYETRVNNIVTRHRWESDLRMEHHVLFNILNNNAVDIGTEEKRLIIRWALYRAIVNERALKELLVPFGDSIGIQEVKFALEKFKKQYGFN